MHVIKKCPHIFGMFTDETKDKLANKFVFILYKNNNNR